MSRLAAAIKGEKRLAAFAMLPMDEPKAAVSELRRCVQELGFLGALIDSHALNGVYYEGAAYREFWATAHELDVPIYIHPTWPSEQVAKSGLFSGDYDKSIDLAMGAFAYGWHADTAISFLKLYGGGISTTIHS
ncbi:hypothetical protein MRB53_039824 [Persea americana]|nr:hypothetical protein MRB53_039824 [Persea americana]